MKYHYTPIKMTKMKKKIVTPSTGENIEKLDHSYAADGNIKWCSHPGKLSGSFFKKN